MSTQTTSLKRQRAAQKQLNKSPVDSLLATDSALQSLDISLDRFISPFDQDPLTLSDETLLNLDLAKLKFVVFLADREGSQ